MRGGVIVFFVEGEPAPKGSLRAFVHRGRAFVTHDNEKTVPWAARVASIAQQFAPPTPLNEPVFVQLAFVLSRPKHHYGRGRNAGVVLPSAPRWSDTKPDFDKVTRAVVDALTVARFWADDSRVCAAWITKEYGETPGVTIAVAPMTALQAQNNAPAIGGAK